MSSPTESKTAQSKYNQYLAGRIYASNAPKIFLETISARTAALIIALTYIFFILGFCIDFYTTYKSFNSSNVSLTALPCGPGGQGIPQGSNNFYSCASGKHWNGTITDLSNVISVKLNVDQTNVTSILSNATAEFDVTFSVELWACYNPGGCNDNFATDTYYTNDVGTWQHVYSEPDDLVRIDVSRDVKKNGLTQSLAANLIPTLFQNQESIPTNGLVKSYFISLEYISDPYSVFVNPTYDPNHPVYYNFDVINRPRQLGINAVTIILLVVTITVLVMYVVMLSRQKKVLSEQKWVVAYFVLLVMFQNPIYCVIVFYSAAPYPSTAYASYVVGYIAQSGLFILWLLFADSVTRKTTSKLYFYGPKVLIGFIIFTFGILILTFQFPGISTSSEKEHPRSAVEAVANWTPELKKQFISFTIIYLVLIWLW